MTPEQQAPSSLPPKLSNTRCLRLFKTDDDELKALCDTLKSKGWDVDIVQTIRDCVHAGLPIVKERWSPLLKDETATVPGAN